MILFVSDVWLTFYIYDWWNKTKLNLIVKIEFLSKIFQVSWMNNVPIKRICRSLTLHWDVESLQKIFILNIMFKNRKLVYILSFWLLLILYPNSYLVQDSTVVVEDSPYVCGILNLIYLRAEIYKKLINNWPRKNKTQIDTNNMKICTN